MFVNLNMACVNDSATLSIGCRSFSGTRVSAIPNSTANTATCNIWFSPTAFTMFSGNTCNRKSSHFSGATFCGP